MTRRDGFPLYTYFIYPYLYSSDDDSFACFGTYMFFIPWGMLVKRCCREEQLQNLYCE